MRKILSKLSFIGIALLFATTVNASVISEYWIDQENGNGAFDITNDTGSDIYGFAVGSNDAVWAYDNSGLGWDADVYDALTWNSGANIELGLNTDTASIGLFSDLFPGFDRAVIYSANRFEPIPLAVGDTATGFEFGTLWLSSPYVTFDQNNNVIDQGQTTHVSAVPVPAAAWLFGSGLVGLAGISRRKA
ncbi:MAG: VPLPA-CTERM sorting domain-containing protein [Methylococcales bacterium]